MRKSGIVFGNEDGGLSVSGSLNGPLRCLTEFTTQFCGEEKASGLLLCLDLLLFFAFPFHLKTPLTDHALVLLILSVCLGVYVRMSIHCPCAV